jgi:hypothetical protein
VVVRAAAPRQIEPRTGFLDSAPIRFAGQFLQGSF